jgi:hypothetical protein
MRRGPTLILALFIAFTLAAPAHAADVGYYFNMAGELVDLPYPGTEFYGEVDLTLLALNDLLVEVNVYTNPGETDHLGNFFTSPIVPGQSFGIDKFGMNSTLIADEADFNTFASLYDITLPDTWSCIWGGVAGDLGKFEFWNTGPGGSRVDPLIIQIAPKIGAVIPVEFQIDSVLDFVELCPQGTYFSMHAGGFTTDPSYWAGDTEPGSSYFAVTTAPEPCTVLIALLAVLPAILHRKRR